MGSLIWAAFGAIQAVFLEVQYRQAETWPLWAVVPALGVTLAIWQTMRGSPSLLQGVVAFNLMVLVARMGASQFVLREPVVKGNLAAALLLGAAIVIGKVWR